MRILAALFVLLAGLLYSTKLQRLYLSRSSLRSALVKSRATTSSVTF